MIREFLIFCFIVGNLSVHGQTDTCFHIVADMGGSLNDRLFLVGNTAKGAVRLGETVMVNGSFEFKGRVQEMTPVYILTEKQQPIATLMLENLEYTLSAGETGIEVKGGGESQRIWNEFDVISRKIRREQFKMQQEVRAAYAEGNQMKLQALQQQFEKIVAETEKEQHVLFEKYSDSPVTALVVAMGMAQMDYTSLSEIYGLLGDAAKNSPYGRMITQQLDRLKQVEVGSEAPDFKAANLDGDTLTLHGIAGKVKLLDFWASWCGPCRQEMPNVCRLYKKYKDKGLEIIGISLDEKRQEWAKTMAAEKMTWPNVSDLKGWKSDIAALYFVKAIPCMLLLDENNRIIAKNLRGRELEKKIEELLGE